MFRSSRISAIAEVVFDDEYLQKWSFGGHGRFPSKGFLSRQCSPHPGRGNGG
jgi:hypothetical protein